ncbi:hypothetical protein As57867_006455, partial [Aphanomyces stellatus]
MLDTTAFFMDDDRVVCSLQATPNPTIMDRLHPQSAKASATLTVLISYAVLSIQHHNCTTNLTASEIDVEMRGTKEVVLRSSSTNSIRYAFATRLEAIEFVGAVNLIQHLDALQDAVVTI